jgi:hypothetical protein
VIWFLFIVLVAFFVIYTIAPLFDRNYRGRKLASESGDYENLLVRKEEILGAINDLEYDFHLNKISEPDYLQIKEKLESEAVQVMMKIDQAEGKTKLDAVRVHASGKKAGKIQS